jgi:dolichol-phosphate mannosyltransferase
MLVIVLVVFGGIFHYLSVGLPGVPYRQDRVKRVAWKQLGEDVRSVESEIEARTGEKPLVVGMDKYNLASELAFYRRHEGEDASHAVANTASRSLFFSSSLMYEIWAPADAYAGRTLILVGFDPETLSNQAIENSVGRSGPVVERRLSKLGIPAGRYYYRVVEDFQGKTRARSSAPR